MKIKMSNCSVLISLFYPALSAASLFTALQQTPSSKFAHLFKSSAADSHLKFALICSTDIPFVPYIS